MTMVVILEGSARRRLQNDYLFQSGTRRARPVRASSFRANRFIQEEQIMSQIAEYNRVLEQAKQRRAEVIGSGLRPYALPIVVIASLSFATLQLASHHEPDPPVKVQTAQLG
jgi:hypothetical protein